MLEFLLLLCAIALAAMGFMLNHVITERDEIRIQLSDKKLERFSELDIPAPSPQEPLRAALSFIATTVHVKHNDGTVLGMVTSYADGVVDIEHRTGKLAGQTHRYDMINSLIEYYEKDQEMPGLKGQEGNVIPLNPRRNPDETN